MPVGEDHENRTHPQISRRTLLSTAVGAAVAGAGVNAFSTPARAWDQFDVEFRGDHEVWLVVGDDLHYDPPLVTHVIVETADGPECRLVEFTEHSTTTIPGQYDDRRVLPYDAGSETVLGVLSYNRHVEGEGQFSRPRCVLLNEYLEEDKAAAACEEADCVQAAMDDHWDGEFVDCWFEALESETVIEECTTITEPGTYDLVTDLEPTEGEYCLEILADDVTIDGNGYTIDGSGVEDTVGILTDADDSADDASGVSIHNLSVTGFDCGVSVTDGDLVALEDVVIEDCDRGVDLGVGTTESTVRLFDSTIEGCAEDGIRSIGFNTVDIGDSSIRNTGVGVSAADTTVKIDGSSIRDNDDDGVAVSDAAVTISDTIIESNGGNGLSHYFAELTVEDVTLRANGGNQLGVTGPLDPRMAPSLSCTATNLVVGGSVTIHDDATVNALDTIDQATLPALPDDVQPVCEGFEVIGRSTTTLEIAVDADSEEADALWRYDGTDWDTVAADIDQELTATIESDGIYVPVVESSE